ERSLGGEDLPLWHLVRDDAIDDHVGGRESVHVPGCAAARRDCQANSKSDRYNQDQSDDEQQSSSLRKAHLISMPERGHDGASTSMVLDAAASPRPSS